MVPQSTSPEKLAPGLASPDADVKEIRPALQGRDIDWSVLRSASYRGGDARSAVYAMGVDRHDGAQLAQHRGAFGIGQAFGSDRRQALLQGRDGGAYCFAAVLAKGFHALMSSVQIHTRR